MFRRKVSEGPFGGARRAARAVRRAASRAFDAPAMR